MRSLSSAAVVATILSTSPLASAYVLAETSAGSPTRWQTDAVEVVVDASIDQLGPGARDAVAASFGAWDAVDGAAVPTVTLTNGTADPIGYRTGDTNHSTVRLVAGGYAPAGSALSVTVATYDASGAFIDADVIVNGLPGLGFAMLDPNAPPAPPGPPMIGANGLVVPAPYDLQNVLTHEAGHFFGMAHAVDDPNDTMFPTSDQGETKKRTLTSDDEDGLRALYPATVATSCSTSMLGAKGPTTWLWAAGLIVAGAALARRRSHKSLAAAPIALAALLGVASSTATAAAPRAPFAVSATPEDAVATVVGTEIHREGGVIFTAIDLAIACPRSAPCADHERRVEVLGGTLDGLSQIASGLRVPGVGERVVLPARADGFAWPSHLAPTRASRAASLLEQSTESEP